MQNFDRGKFNVFQIDFIVRALERMGEHPLVILPHKYMEGSFNLQLGMSSKTQTLNSVERSLLQDLNDSGRLFTVPPGCLDDYFWMLATIADQSKCETESSCGVASSDMEPLWSGGRPVVMTNDQIRDHKEHELGEPRAFNRWYSNAVVNYTFTGFVDDECVDHEVAFTPADSFSREIQCNEIKSTNAIAWHFPVQDWETTDWFCIRLPKVLGQA